MNFFYFYRVHGNTAYGLETIGTIFPVEDSGTYGSYHILTKEYL